LGHGNCRAYQPDNDGYWYCRVFADMSYENGRREKCKLDDLKAATDLLGCFVKAQTDLVMAREGGQN
jgi:hypothetical protein